MNETTQSSELTRREAIRKGAIATGAAMFGGAGAAGNVAARRSKNGNLVSAVSSHGHYSHFPSGSWDTWKRMKNPFDTSSGDSRWKAKPAAGGSIRSIVENLPFPRNAGVDVHLGPVGDINSITIDAETIETQSGNIALYGVALYLDVSNNGTFFAWRGGRGNTEVFDGFGGDGEAITVAPANGKFTVDENTSFPIVAELGLGAPKKWKEIVDSVGPETDAALYVGVVGNEEASGREEIVLHSMDVNRD